MIKLAKKIGEVTHYFNKIGVAILKLSSDLKVGDKIKIKGHTTDLEQTVEEIQIDHKPVNEAKKGKEIGVRVDDHVREGDEAFLDS